MRCNFSVKALWALSMASQVLCTEPTPQFDSIYTPKRSEVVAAGSTFLITWEANSYRDGSISIALLGGDSQTTLQKVMNIATGVKNSDAKYSWEVDAGLGGNNTYGLHLSLDGSNGKIYQWSNPFKIASSASGVVAPLEGGSIKSTASSTSGSTATAQASIRQSTTSTIQNSSSVQPSISTTAVASVSSADIISKTTANAKASGSVSTMANATQTKSTTVATQSSKSGAVASAVGATSLILALSLQFLLL